MTTRFRLHALVLLCLLVLAGAGPHGCRCGSDPEVPEKPKTGTAGLPESYPTAASHAAEELGAYLPKDSDAVVLVASYAALVGLTDTIKAWGVVDPDEMDGIFASLERYHGINPGRADSWQGNGFPLTGGLAIGRFEGSWFVVTRVANDASFDAFVDGLINEEYGRPRPRETQHDGFDIVSVNVLKRDLVSMARVDDVAILVAGDRAVAGSPPSLDAMKALLDARKVDPISASESFEAMRERVGETGFVMFYTSHGDLAAQLLAPTLPDDDTIKSAVDTTLGDDLTAFALAIGADDGGVVARGFAQIGGETLERVTTLATPDPLAPDGLERFVTEDVTGVVRATFAVRPVESLALSVTDEKAAKRWQKLKGQLAVPFLVNFSDEVLYNLGGQVLVTLFEVDREATLPGEDLAEIARSGTRAAVYLTLKDKAVGNGFFGKVNALKDLVTSMIPDGRIAFEDVDGTLVVTIKEGRDAAAYVAYRDGVIAAMSPDDATRERVLARLAAPADDAPARADFIPDELLGPGAVFGVAVDVTQIVTLLSARYDIVEMQINRFLSPLDTVATRFDVVDDGIEMNLRIGLRPPPETEAETDDRGAN